MNRLLFLLSLLFSFGNLAICQISIIPKPNSLTYTNGKTNLETIKFITNTSSEFSSEVEFLNYSFEQIIGKKLKTGKPKKSSGSIILKKIETGDTSAYNLIINNSGITIESSGSAGIFYGIQTLIQIFHQHQNFSIPQLIIKDAPRFSWRGMHLDCSRHFFTVDEVKRYIDYLSFYKMNVFHWHLTDDQGWRIEIKKYPKTTEVSAWRNGSMIGAYSNHQFDSIRYGGFYTQEQIREVVAYAAMRHVTIVPEIEMPGHSLAVLAAYPHLACRDSVFETAKQWGVFDDVLCAGNEEVFQFLYDVLDEVISLFPSEYIHIGGDECPKTRWKECPKCQKRITDENLKDEHHLQSYFIQRIEKYLNSKGRKIIGWDEILEGGLAPNAAVMSWRGLEGGTAAAQSGHYAVMTPGKPCYFDHYQSPDKSTEPHAIGGLNTLSDVYHYEPIPHMLSASEASYILGAQGNVWTEYILSFSHVEYMALPRMIALAEVLWTNPDLKNYEDFIQRLKQNVLILNRLQTNYAKHFLTE